MNDQGIRFRIGVFVLTSMILLAVLIILFGRFPTIFKGMTRRYYVMFQYAPGVSVNTPVRRSGVRIGQVEKVELDDETGQVRVTVAIDPPHVLYTDDTPRLVHGALSGDTSIDFEAPKQPQPREVPEAGGKIQPEGAIKPVAFLLAQQPAGKGAQPAPPAGQRQPAPPNTVFQGASQSDVSTLLAEISRLTPPARDAFLEMQKFLESSRQLIPELRRSNDEINVAARNWGKLGERLDVLVQTNEDKLVRTLDNVNTTIQRVGTVFSDENQRNLATTLKNVSAGSKNLEVVMRDADDLLRDSRVTIKHFSDSLGQADQVLSNLQIASKPLAERSDSIMRNLDESTVRLNKALTELDELFRTINQSDGALRHFIGDPALYNNLNDAASMLTHSLPRIDRILHDFEVFADKIARHPESLGVGGAIRPSAGLKEAPTTSHWRGPEH